MSNVAASFTIGPRNPVKADFEVNPNNPIDTTFTLNVVNKDHAVLKNRDLPDQHPIDAITGLRTVVDKIPEIEQEIAGKQDQLSESQLEAVNSGITSEGVAKIETSVQTISVENGLEVERSGQDVTISNPSFVFEQGIASDTWVINHNLGKRPSITLVDSSGREFKTVCDYINDNQIIVRLASATTGFAYLN